MENSLKHKISNSIMLCYAYLEDTDKHQLRNEIHNLMDMWKMYCDIGTNSGDMMIGKTGE